MTEEQSGRPIQLKARARLSICQGTLKLVEQADPTFVMDLCQQLMYEKLMAMSDTEVINTFRTLEAELEKQAMKSREGQNETTTEKGETVPSDKTSS